MLSGDDVFRGIEGDETAAEEIQRRAPHSKDFAWSTSSCRLQSPATVCDSPMPRTPATQMLATNASRVLCLRPLRTSPWMTSPFW
jgi:hypothetical protein